MNIYKFKNSIELGKQGEDVIINYSTKQTDIIEIKDVRENKIYQNADIDIIIKTMFDNYSVEIKTDSYDTGNIYYETMSSLENNSIGCMEKTEADYIYYYFINTNELYILDREKYVKWFHDNAFQFKKSQVLNKTKNGIYTSEGYLIKKSFLEKKFKNFRKEILYKL